ncbi:hypothetical protein KAFR_0B00550 [Kazachstania africana CBS 2517]|uniref:Mediator of RNA polymerase II transcription subunit 17 n=1 Tax=Kazachstania africana (strain ATCC 22294 / BCRC 22015 / CBS 2517 / CECT 1963 / NBRC 1671 / NRRL Y-8276) TaxID=1071382 RepID=H2APQ4_KAZAF|nr:hypothetical protein KAFR_0B00550 [Kazachstania africana CBS 2517]CCF56354.1 hypothetical protein KAFR_0B00550 [Kazachstania africana CBS 2517]
MGKSQFDFEKGVNLALDPNLLSLPSKKSPSSPNAADQQKEPIVPPATAQEINELVSNPYEIYGKMPLAQLVPLILQQKQIPFSELSQDYILKETSEKVMDSNDAMDNEPQLPDNSKSNFSTMDASESYETIRSKMIDHINVAMNESSLALETVSLLLSGVRENNAKSSISPYLKRNVPMGSLNSDRIPINNSNNVKKTNEKIKFSFGWKLKCLDDSKLMLKKNVDKLFEIVRRENKYWQMISQVIVNTDVIFKLRDKLSGERLIGIKYGFEDSGSNYHLDRGIAVLKNNTELNQLELIPYYNNKNFSIHDSNIRIGYTFIRIRIFTKIESEDDFILSGESSITNNDSTNIRDQIKKFKDIIFEKELMYQLKKESSQLISYGVKIENENKIMIELPNEKIEIELLQVDDLSTVMNEQDNPKINDKRANLILITLRLLLVVIFKKNLRRRSTTNSISNHNGSYSEDILLIRPILGKLRHQNYKILLKKIIKQNILDIIESSQCQEIKITRKPNNDTTRTVDKHIDKLNKDIASFDNLINTPVSHFEVSLPDRKDSFKLVLESPNYCNAIISVKYKDPLNDNRAFDAKFTELKEVEEFLYFIITEYILKKETEEHIPIKQEH